MLTIHRTNRRSSLYYVESITQINEPRTEYNGRATALLQYIPLNIFDWEQQNRDFKWYIKVPIATGQTEIVHEGSYVNYLKINGFISANDDDRAKKIIDRSNQLLRRAENMIDHNHKIPELNNISMLFSYHVNVGHGNLSLLVIEHNHKISIWMVDGSNFDARIRRNYTTEIKNCLDHIIRKFGLSRTPHIDVLMITHAHYDHYSGITAFIRNGLIDSHTLVYLNLNIKTNSHNFNNLLTAIIDNKMVIIPPFVQNSSQNINILYPDQKTYSNSLKLNNTSSVYCIQFDETPYFVFPGDLESSGWDLMDNNHCCPYMKSPKYYAISHHGSKNGHIRHKCKFRHIESIADCLNQQTKTVLMGRNKAFDGIYSDCVLKDFKGRLYYSEKDNCNNYSEFLEIDLLSGTESWY